MKTETCKLYSRVFRTFLPNIIKIDLYNFDYTVSKLGHFLRHSVHKLMDWSNDWHMTFNVDKCKVMHVGRTNLHSKYYINGRLQRTGAILISGNISFQNEL